MEPILSCASIKRPASPTASEHPSQHLRQTNDSASVLPLRLLRVTQSHAQVIQTEGLPLEARPRHYTIISHVWGEELVTLSESQLNSFVTGITWPVAIDASEPDKIGRIIQMARDRGIDYMWIDILCIDPGNKPEKALEISKLQRYYRHCEACIVALPFEQQSLDFLLGHLMMLARRAIPGWPHIVSADPFEWFGMEQPDAALSTDLIDIIYCLCFLSQSAWFERVWTYQEAVLPEEVYFWYGQPNSELVDIDQLINVVCCAPAIMRWSLMEGSRRERTGPLIFSFSRKVFEIAHGRQRFRKFDAGRAMSICGSRQTTKPADKIVGFLALLDYMADDATFRTDHAKHFTAFKAFSTKALLAGDFSLAFNSAYGYELLERGYMPRSTGSNIFSPCGGSRLLEAATNNEHGGITLKAVVVENPGVIHLPERPRLWSGALIFELPFGPAQMLPHDIGTLVARVAEVKDTTIGRLISICHVQQDPLPTQTLSGLGVDFDALDDASRAVMFAIESFLVGLFDEDALFAALTECEAEDNARMAEEADALRQFQERNTRENIPTRTVDDGLPTFAYRNLIPGTVLFASNSDGSLSTLLVTKVSPGETSAWSVDNPVAKCLEVLKRAEESLREILALDDQRQPTALLHFKFGLPEPISVLMVTGQLQTWGDWSRPDRAVSIVFPCEPLKVDYNGNAEARMSALPADHAIPQRSFLRGLICTQRREAHTGLDHLTTSPLRWIVGHGVVFGNIDTIARAERMNVETHGYASPEEFSHILA